ncbi:hypothetical protein BS17DRAFT_777622 [Gyrodon lividus]|nr:hypothetical protein BS17DRAFT_777622 [Gyrodon lividus]
MGMASYSLHLNKTHLLFIPTPEVTSDTGSTPGQGTTGTVVQVCLRSSCDSEESRERALFSVERAIITNTIETLLIAYINATPKPPERVVVTESLLGYNLVGVRKPWKYGRGKQFFLGETSLQPADDKWIFHFEITK